MKVINLGESNTILNKFVAQMRDIEVQKDSLRFRRNLERAGEIFAYEISKTLEYSEKPVTTPLGIANMSTHNYFDDAQNAFVAAYRKFNKSEGFTINIEYASTPDLEGKVLIIADAMLATGASLEMTYKKLLEHGTPAYTHIVCPVSSAYAVEYLQKNIDGDRITLWVAGIDEELTSRSYIVPGLGDAGDLAYGNKK